MALPFGARGDFVTHAVERRARHVLRTRDDEEKITLVKCQLLHCFGGKKLGRGPLERGIISATDLETFTVTDDAGRQMTGRLAELSASSLALLGVITST